MYVDSLGKDWMKHDFLRNSFLIKDEAVLRKLKSSKLKQVVIDTDKGMDVKPDKPQQPAEVSQTKKPDKPLYPKTSAADIKQAKKAFKMASKVVDDLMHDVRSGKALNKE